MTPDRPVLAVDIGGTKLAAAIVDTGGRVAGYAQTPTPQGEQVDAEALWRTLVVLVDGVLDSAAGGVDGADGLAGVGVGCGGPMQWPDGVVSPLNIPAWRGFPLLDRLRDRFPRLAVRVHNDAVCTAIGEHWRGAGKGADNVLGMVVSTGVGGGLVLGGRLVDGASGNAGHVGHIVVDPDGPECSCGGYGCVEAIAGGPRLTDWALAQGWTSTEGSTATDLTRDAARGHPTAQAAMRRAGEALGVAIASATHLCDLEVVAIGGGLAQAGQLLFGPLEEAFRRHAQMEFARDLRVVPARLGQQAGLVGAAALVLAGDSYWSAK
jgi:glucokinase